MKYKTYLVTVLCGALLSLTFPACPRDEIINGIKERELHKSVIQ